MCREKLYIVFALLFVMLASNVVAQAQPSLTIQNANVPVGNSVDVNVSFTNPDSNVGSIQFDVVFNSDVASFDNAVAGAALSPWTIFVQERGAGRVTIGSIPDASSPETVISEGDIFVLQFTGLVEDMSTALIIEQSAGTNTIFTTFDGMAIEAGPLNAGSIMVVGGQPQPPPPTPGGQPGDANADGFVNLADLGVIINAFRGTQTAPGNGDCNGDTFTNLADLGCVITVFRAPPSGPTPTPPPSSCPPGEKECTGGCIPIGAGCCGDGTFCPATNPVCCPPAGAFCAPNASECPGM